MTELEQRLRTIVNEKETKILPENIRKGITVLGVEGKLEEDSGGIDTSDADATVDDIINPKTAYVNGKKIEGQIIGNYDTLRPDVEDGNIAYSKTINDTDYEHSLAVGTDNTNIYIYDILENSIDTTPKISLNKSIFGNKTIYNVVFGSNTDTTLKLWVVSHTSSSDLEIHLVVLDYQGTVLKDYKYTNTTWMGDGMWYGVGNILIPHPSRDMVCWVNPNVTNGGKCNTIILTLSEDTLMQVYYSRTAGHTNSYYYGPSTITGSWSSDGRYVSCIYRTSNGEINNIVVLCNETFTSASSVVSGIPSVTTYGLRLNVLIKNNEVYDNGVKVATLPYSIKSYYAIVVFAGYFCIIHNNTLDVFDSNTYELLNTINDISNIYYPHEYLQLKVYNVASYRFLGVKLSADYTSLIRKNTTFYDTTTADVTSNDVVKGKIAFSSTGKVEGDLYDLRTATGLEVVTGATLQNTVGGYDDVAGKFMMTGNLPQTTIVGDNNQVYASLSKENICESIDLTADKIKSGETILGIEGTCDYIKYADSITEYNTSKAILSRITEISVPDTTGVTNFDEAFRYMENVVELPWIDTSSATTMSFAFQYMRKLTSLPHIDTSNVMNMHIAFGVCTSLTTLPLLDLSSVKNAWGMCGGCANLIELPQFNLSSATDVACMCDDCYKLKTVPVLNISSATKVEKMFGDCSSLTDDSLNNILATLTGATAYIAQGTNMTLAYVGLTEEQATKCTTLSNYAAFTAAGWSTGY